MMVSIRYASHLPILSKIFEITKGPILELGIGLYSTPFLHWMSFTAKRKLTSYDSDPKWIRYFRDSKSDFHEILQIDDWDSLKIDKYWDLALIDHAPDARRGIEAGRLAKNAKFVILHDSEPESDTKYGYSKIYPLFKYRFDYTDALPNTTVLSNYVDLRNI